MQPNGPMGFAPNTIRHGPALQNDPNARETIDAIESGDANRGRQIARGLCDAYGVEPEDAIAQAKSFFHI